VRAKPIPWFVIPPFRFGYPNRGPLLALLALGALASAHATPPPPDTLAEEISIQLTVDRLGATFVPALYANNDAYLPLLEIFKFLEVKTTATEGGRIVTGFFIEEENQYTIDLNERRIRVGSNERWIAEDEVITTETEIFLRPRVIAEAFDVECRFNFRTLHVRMSCARDFPALRLMERRGAHKRLEVRRDTVVIDRRFDRHPGGVRFGVIDWQLGSSRSLERHIENYAFAAGGEFLGGDISARIDGILGDTIDWGSLDWQWRFADPEPGFLTQAIYGRALTPVIPVGYGLLDGFTLNNRPTSQRRAFGTYVVTGTTEPGWLVDVYVNSQLITFTAADESGHYEIAIPLSYGATSITLKFLGPWGEERTREQVIRVPYTFLPPGQVEYAVIGGVSREESPRWVGQGAAHVGIFPDLTLGAGLQYVSKWPRSTLLPYAAASLRISDEILASAEYSQEYRLTGRASYVGPGGRAIDLTYQRLYSDRSYGSRSGDLHKGRLSLSSPYRFSLVSGFGSIAGTYESGLSDLSMFGAEANVGVSFERFYLGYFFYGLFPRGAGGEALRGSLSSNFSLSRQTLWQISTRVGLRFDHLTDRPTSASASIERSVFGLGHAALGGVYNFADRRTILQFDFRYNLPFVGTRISLRSDQGELSLTQLLNGTLAYDGGAGDIVPGNRSAVGRGSISIIPFLDENNNGLVDPDEPAVEHMEVKVNGGRILRGDDGIVRIVELQPYETYTIELSARNLEYLTWRPLFKTIQVVADPNSFKEILLPVTVAGEVVGAVRRSTGGLVMGQGGIRVLFRSMTTGRVDTAMTFSNGEFDLMGLPAGQYQAYVDRSQLRALNLGSSPAMIDVTLRGIREGDFVDNVSFTLAPRPVRRSNDPDAIAEMEEPYPVGFNFMVTVVPPDQELPVESVEALDGLAARIEADATIGIELQGMLDESYSQEDVAATQIHLHRLRSYLVDAGVPATAVRTRPPLSNLVGDQGRKVVAVTIIRR